VCKTREKKPDEGKPFISSLRNEGRAIDGNRGFAGMNMNKHYLRDFNIFTAD
jgi:hypothetical protein